MSSSTQDHKVSPRRCESCDSEIPEGRLKAVPGVTTCVRCSDTEKVAGHAIISSKTEYSALQIVDQKTKKRLEKLQHRSKYGSSLKFDSISNKSI